MSLSRTKGGRGIVPVSNISQTSPTLPICGSQMSRNPCISCNGCPSYHLERRISPPASLPAPPLPFHTIQWRGRRAAFPPSVPYPRCGGHRHIGKDLGENPYSATAGGPSRSQDRVGDDCTVWVQYHSRRHRPKPSWCPPPSYGAPPLSQPVPETRACHRHVECHVAIGFHHSVNDHGHATFLVPRPMQATSARRAQRDWLGGCLPRRRRDRQRDLARRVALTG